MFSVKKAENSKSDIETINRLAWLAFPATYRGLLTPDQIVFMMNWMYSGEYLDRCKITILIFICY
ncbi:MAG: hypothetical protein ACLUKN_16560 [Bacilli bacterium]